MNLWDKLKKTGAAICLLTFVACEDPTKLGQDLQDLKDIEIRYAEIPLEAGMIRVDSVNTTNRGYLAVGEVTDPVFGKLKATAFTNLSYSRVDSLGPRHVYDSTVLILFLSDYYSIGNSSQFGIEVRELTEGFDFEGQYLTSSEGIVYNDEVLLGSKTKLIGPTSASSLDTVSIRVTLDKDWGSKFFTLLRSDKIFEDDTLKFSQKIFNRDISKGLAIIPTSTDGLFKFNTNQQYSAERILTSSMRVYYHTKNDKNETIISYANFELNYPEVNTRYVKGFTKVEVDRSSSTMNFVETKDEFELFTSPDNKIYSSNISGILPVLNFSNVYSFLDTLDNMIVNRADLILEGIDNSNISREPRPYNFIMYWVGDTIDIDYYNTVPNGGVNPLAKTTPAFLSYGKDEYYNADISSTIQGLYDKTLSKKNILLANSQNSTFFNYFFPNSNFSRLEITNVKLGVYYTVPIKK